MVKTTRFIFIGVIAVMIAGYGFLLQRNSGFQKQISEVGAQK